jgi:hypothetical protein
VQAAPADAIDDELPGRARRCGVTRIDAARHARLGRAGVAGRETGDSSLRGP